jgi:hypothetical protein
VSTKTSERHLGSGRGAGTATQSGAAKVKHGAEQVRHNRAFRWFARAGLLARAVVYLVLGGLVLQIGSSGHGSSQADAQGAFAEVGRQPAGTETLALLAAGLAAYAVWRFIEASSRRPQGQQISPWSRLGWYAAGGLYVALCVSVIRIIAGSGSSQKAEQHPSSFAADILRVPAGPALLGLIAAAVAAGGIGLIAWGLRHDYAKELRTDQMTRRVRTVTRWSGMLGNTVRGIAVLLVASSLFLSAVSDDPARAKSLDTALYSLAGSPAGAALLVIVGAGFVSFGFHSVFEARFRRV